MTVVALTLAAASLALVVGFIAGVSVGRGHPVGPQDIRIPRCAVPLCARPAVTEVCAEHVASTAEF